MSEENHMSRTEAVQHLMKIAGEDVRTVDEITALQMATFRLVQRYCQHLRHKARKHCASVACVEVEPQAKEGCAE